MSPAMETLRFDVVVIGSGPAGSTAAALLAREGRRVALLERQRLPRYHIGESLIPSVLPFLEELGVADEVRAAGFQRKVGQTFVWGRDRTPWVLDFGELDVYPSAYFVERGDFDHLLARNAARLGAELLEGVTVRGTIREGARVVGLRAERDGAPVEVRARYVIDASGQDAVLAHELTERRYIEGLKSLAVWSYWEGAARLPGDATDHIVTVSTPTGWVWFIPLSPERTSVGVVTSDWSALRGEAPASLDAFYTAALQGVEIVPGLLRDARRCADVRSARDWSYCASRFAGEGYFLAGDAACFIDPILSTGVHLAMSGGYLAALAANSALAEPQLEAAFAQYFQRSYGAIYRELLAQVRHFYRVEAWREDVFWKSKRIVDADPRLEGSLAFVFLTSGLARHVTAAAPHDVATQARAAFASKLSGDARETAYAPRAAARALSDGRGVVLRASDGRLLRASQEGLRLRLTPCPDAGITERPPSSAFAIEVSDRDGLPLGVLLVEALRPDLPERARRVRGLAVTPRPYRWRDADRATLDDAAARCARVIAESHDDDLDALREGLPRALRAESDPAWDVTSPAPLSDLADAAPVLLELARDGALSLRVTVSVRRAPEAHENPYWRGRLVDVDYHLQPADAPLPTEALRGVIEVLRALEGRCDDASAALVACPAALANYARGPWRVTGARRMPRLDDAD
ncbi:MAG: tryptophan 7-halogenase [Polyangiales bacterium]